jgi:hypothetical protein
VGPRQVLADIIAPTGAHQINQGSVPDLAKPAGQCDVYFVPADEPELRRHRLSRW